MHVDPPIAQDAERLGSSFPRRVWERVGRAWQRDGRPRAAYVHVPFCRHRCGYCDFTLLAGRDELIGDYLRALEIELFSLDDPRGSVAASLRESMRTRGASPPHFVIEIDTLFLGGGTPTHLSAEQLTRLMELLHRRFRLSAGCEFSVEANPAGLCDEKIAVLAEAGVNRVSLGVQSFDDELLRVLERDHRRGDVISAVERLRQHGIENVSFDLIFGVPGQSPGLWQETLKEAINLAPQHISTYGLTWEKGTAFWSRRMKGELTPVAEETERAMYAAAMDLLPAAGYEQYEISSFARPGFRCRHNLVYWNGGEYHGFGPGAARYVAGRRETNHRSVTRWLKRVLVGESAVGESEALAPEERARELLVLGLRTCEGVDRDDFRSRTGFDIEAVAADAVARHSSSGLLQQTPTHIRLTREGRFLADLVAVDLL